MFVLTAAELLQVYILLVAAVGVVYSVEFAFGKPDVDGDLAETACHHGAALSQMLNFLLHFVGLLVTFFWLY